MKPPSLAVVMGGRGEPDDEEAPESDEGGDDQAQLDASQAAIDAVHAKDPAAFNEAIGALCKLHYESMDAEEGEAPEGEG